MNERLKKIFGVITQRVAQKPYFWTTFVAVAGLLLIPLLIWLSFFIGDNGFIVIHTSLSVGDALSFYGTVLAFISTGVLGIIAVMQNNRLQKLETDVAARNNSCSIYIENTKAHVTIRLSNDNECPYEVSNSYIRLKISNYSEAFLKKISIQFGDNIFTSHLTLIKGSPKNVKILLPQNFCANTMPLCKITFTSCYDVDTYADFQMVVKNTPHIPKIRYYHFYGTTDKSVSRCDFIL